MLQWVMATKKGFPAKESEFAWIGLKIVAIKISLCSSQIGEKKPRNPKLPSPVRILINQNQKYKRNWNMILFEWEWTNKGTSEAILASNNLEIASLK